MNYGDYPNLIQLLDTTVNRYSDRGALFYDQQQFTYREFWQKARQFAAVLNKLGMHQGDRIALLLPNIPEFVIAHFGILMNGCVVVPLNIMLKGHEIQYIMEDSESKLLLIWDKLEGEIQSAVMHDDFHSMIIVFGESKLPGVLIWDELLKQASAESEMPEIKPEELAVILYTSGTTGYPRGVELTHQNLTSNALACVEAGVVTARDICLGVLPFYHSFGQTAVMHTCVASGALNVMLAKFDSAVVIDSIQKHQVSIFAAVPTMFKMMVDAQKEVIKLPSIRTCLSGGAKLDLNIYHEFGIKFGLPIYEGYGLTEASPVVAFNPMDFRSKPGSVGLPISGIDIKIVDDQGNELTPNNVGEIILRGPNVMQGYLNRPEATKEVLRDGWLFTGDIGKIDDDGYLYILDRKRDLIIKGGFNVYPKEIEQVIAYHPKVKEVAVIGVPDPVQGEEVKAFISLKTGKRASKAEIIEYCQEHMANYKCPKYITFLRSLPKSSSGRILKRKLYVQKSK